MDIDDVLALQEENKDVIGRHEPMPQTIEYYKAQQKREGKLILEMKEEISDLKVRNDRLEKKLLKRNNNVT